MASIMSKSEKVFDHDEKRAEHITRRYEHHKSFRKLADEFDISKSQAHRIVSGS